MRFTAVQAITLALLTFSSDAIGVSPAVLLLNGQVLTQAAETDDELNGGSLPADSDRAPQERLLRSLEEQNKSRAERLQQTNIHLFRDRRTGVPTFTNKLTNDRGVSGGGLQVNAAQPPLEWQLQRYLIVLLIGICGLIGVTYAFRQLAKWQKSRPPVTSARRISRTCMATAALLVVALAFPPTVHRDRGISTSQGWRFIGSEFPRGQTVNTGLLFVELAATVALGGVLVLRHVLTGLGRETHASPVGPAEGTSVLPTAPPTGAGAHRNTSHAPADASAVAMTSNPQAPPTVSVAPLPGPPSPIGEASVAKRTWYWLLLFSWVPLTFALYAILVTAAKEESVPIGFPAKMTYLVVLICVVPDLLRSGLGTKPKLSKNGLVLIVTTPLALIGSIALLMASVVSQQRGVPGADKPHSPTLEDEWPSVFTRGAAQPSNPNATPVFPALTKETAADIGAAYGFWGGQKEGVEVIEQKYPDLIPRLNVAEVHFNLRFRPALKQVDGLFEEVGMSKDTSRKVEEAKRQIRQTRYTRKTAEAFVQEVEARGQGKIPSPMLEALLSMHPDYLRYPEREFVDGYTREYRSDGSEKARGLDIGLKHPLSWAAEDGRRPHIVQKFRSQRGCGGATAMLLVVPAPGSAFVEMLTAASPRENGQALLAWVDKELTARLSLDDAGRARILGRPALWVVASGESQHAGYNRPIRMLYFSFQYGENLIQLQFTVSPEGPEETLDDASFRYGELFQAMLASLECSTGTRTVRRLS